MDDYSKIFKLNSYVSFNLNNKKKKKKKKKMVELKFVSVEKIP